MNFSEPTTVCKKKITIENHLPGIGRDAIITNIIEGLISNPRRISSMFFYDAVGSKLFEQITRLEEYYPTRTEKNLLSQLAQKYQDSLHNMDIVELGSGDCSKISIILNALDQLSLETIRYIPVDVSQDAVEESAQILIDEFPGLTVHGLVADFLSQLCELPQGKQRLFFFFGSTIGNLTQAQRDHFFQVLNRIMQPQDTLILGVDMVKETDIIEQAYNDSEGVTAAFNRNILNVVNSLAQTDFPPEAFDHVAFYNHEQSRIEMHLRADRDLLITCPHLSYKLPIAKDELIHTEYSHKFSQDAIIKQINEAGLRVEDITTDQSNWFSLLHITKKKCFV